MLTLLLASFVALSSETNFQFRTRLLEVHRQQLRSDAPSLAPDETVIDGSWRIVAETDDPVVRHAAEDLADYFAKAMDVGGSEKVRSRLVLIAVDPALEKLQSRITVTADRIRIAGGTPREAARRLVNVGDFFRRSWTNC